jgi:hypothetical protein
MNPFGCLLLGIIHPVGTVVAMKVPKRAINREEKDESNPKVA